MIRRLAATVIAALSLVLTACNDDGANVRPGGGSGSGPGSGSASTGSE